MDRDLSKKGTFSNRNGFQRRRHGENRIREITGGTVERLARVRFVFRRVGRAGDCGGFGNR